MGLMSIFKRPVERRDFDSSDIVTEFCIYQPTDEFAEPGMDIPLEPVMSGRTSEQGGRQ